MLLQNRLTSKGGDEINAFILLIDDDVGKFLTRHSKLVLVCTLILMSLKIKGTAQFQLSLPH
jgi:hypothetical protein